MEEKAKYQISSSVRDGILEIIYTGPVSDDDFPDLQDKTIDIIKANNTGKVIFDIRGVIGRFKYSATYFNVRNLPSDRPVSHVAILDTPEHADFGSFVETTAFNAGLFWKCFTDINDARIWLTGIRGSS